MIAITLVVAALGLGLYMQFAMNFWLAVMVALTAYAALITVHALVRRGQIVADLEAEVRELRQQLEQRRAPDSVQPGRDAPSAPTGQPSRAPSDTRSQTSVAKPAPNAKPPVVPTEPPAASERRDVAAPGRPQAPPLPGSPPPSIEPAVTSTQTHVSASSVPSAQSAPPSPSAGSRPAQAAQKPPAPMPPPAFPVVAAEVRADVPPPAPPQPSQRQMIADAVTAIRNAPVADSAPNPQQAAMVATPPPVPSQLPAAAAASSPAAGPTPPPFANPASAPASAVPPAWSAAPARVLGAPTPEVRETVPSHSSDATMAPYWALRPGERPEPELPKPAEVSRQATASAALAQPQPPVLRSAEILAARPIAQAQPGNVPDFLPPARPAEQSKSVAEARDPSSEIPNSASETAKPKIDALQPGDDPSGPDLETMQQLIQQLAAQLNKPAARAADGPAGEAQSPSALPARAVAPAEQLQIEQSVAALRQMADVMHKPAADVFGGEPPALASHRQKSAAAVETSPDAAAASSDTETGPSPYARLAVIAEAVASDRVDLLLDPILALEDRKARHFEVSVRLRGDADEPLATEDCHAILAGTGLLARIDAAKMTRTAAVADRLAQRGSSASLFANLQPESLADNGFLDSFADTFVDQQPICARLVLSFTQADVRDFADVHWEAIATMSELGFRFALEHVTDLDMDFELLKDHGFGFVKLDASVFLEGMPSGDDMVPSADICRHLSGLGLGLIVGGIVDEIDLAKIVGFGVVFGQGTLFGAPRSVAVDVRSRAAA